jgi:CBS domain-containing protein
MQATVKDVMSTNVAAVQRGAALKKVAAVLRERRVSAVPVLDDAGRVVGVVSEADLLSKLAASPLPAGTIRLAWRLRDAAATAGTAGDLMTSPAVTIGPEQTVAQAARLMQDRHVRRLPVVTGDSRLAGIVSRADLLTVFDRPDETIRDEAVNAVAAAQPGVDRDEIDVTVRAGVVTVAGPVSCRRAALDLMATIRFVDGVIAVRDRLSYPAQT